jgi:hypothetical protein
MNILKEILISKWPLKQKMKILSNYVLNQQSHYVKWGAQHLVPTYSNLPDCLRFKCSPTPWNWATHWVLERAKLSGKEVVCDLGAGNNPIALTAYAKKAYIAYLVDNLVLPPEKKYCF